MPNNLIIATISVDGEEFAFYQHDPRYVNCDLYGSISVG